MAAEDIELPSDLLELMEQFDSSLNDCNEVVGSLTSTPLLDMKNKLEPIESARLDLTTAYTINSLFWAYLVTQGVNATEHPVKSELDRIKAYMSKVKNTEDKVKGATLKIHKEAAKRFIKSALWTEEDKNTEKASTKKKDSVKQGTDPTNEKTEDNFSKRKHSEDRHKKNKKKKKKVKQE